MPFPLVPVKTSLRERPVLVLLLAGTKRGVWSVVPRLIVVRRIESFTSPSSILSPCIWVRSRSLSRGSGTKGEEMQEEPEVLAPLLSHLQRFCDDLREGDDGATDRMIAGVEGIWPEVPSADALLAEHEPKPTLAWTRANLIVDLRLFKASNTAASLDSHLEEAANG